MVNNKNSNCEVCEVKVYERDLIYNEYINKFVCIKCNGEIDEDW